MSIIDLNADLNGVEDVQERDTLGGRLLDSSIQDFKITLAYLLKSSGGALGMHVNLENSDGAKLTDTQYITSGNQKGNKPYYEKDGKKLPMPGLQHFNSLSQLVADKDVAALEQKSGVIKLYNSQEGKEVPTEVIVLPELQGKKVKAGVIRKVENKSVKQGNTYVKTNEKREYNEVNKYFDESGATRTELQAKETPVFIDKWKEKYEGQVLDYFKEQANAPSAASQSGGTSNPLAGGNVAEAADDLFDEED